MDEEYGTVNRAGAFGFCTTRTSELIEGLLRSAADHGEMALIVGAAGVGKTTMLKRFASQHQNVAYGVFNPAYALSMTAAMAVICEAIGVVPPRRRYDLHEAICAWARYRIDEGAMLILDEAQQANDLVLDNIRCIHDETGLCIVLAGNDTLRSRFNNVRAAGFAQVTSRVGLRLFLDRTLPADIEALADHAGAISNEAKAYLKRQWTTLREVERHLRYGRDRSGPGCEITLAHLKAAAIDMGVQS